MRAVGTSVSCGARATHAPTGITAEISSYVFVNTKKLKETAIIILRQRLWSHRHIELPLKEVARYEFDGDGYREFERPETILDRRLMDRNP